MGLMTVDQWLWLRQEERRSGARCRAVPLDMPRQIVGGDYPSLVGCRTTDVRYQGSRNRRMSSYVRGMVLRRSIVAERAYSAPSFDNEMSHFRHAFDLANREAAQIAAEAEKVERSRSWHARAAKLAAADRQVRVSYNEKAAAVRAWSAEWDEATRVRRADHDARWERASRIAATVCADRLHEWASIWCILVGHSPLPSSPVAWMSGMSDVAIISLIEQLIITGVV